MSTSTEGPKQDLADHSSSSTPGSQQTVFTIKLNGTEKEDKLNEKSSEKKPDKPLAENNEEFSPPDGGWGWVVMIASMVLILLTDGIAFSVGTIYPTIRDDFNSESTKASLISALINAFSLLTGPVASVLADSYGHRVVVISGSIISGVAFVAASFSPNIDVAILTYGFLAGTGFSLMYVSSVVVVGQYFERRRALAIGIASSGSGIGIFLISAITGALLNVISWRTVSLIEAALMILGILSGLTLHPLPKPKENKEKISKRKLLMKRLDITLFKMPAYNTICMVFILATIAADAALTPLVLIEIVGYSRLNSSVGFMCMFRGFPILIAGPIGGYLRDVTGKYDATFFMAGSTLLVSALFCLITWFIIRMSKCKTYTLSKVKTETVTIS
ncbi:monocarboxylate transporter 10-like isoform X2 [Octopus sinensis]|uniref:Monocarboxylate transporter 10-like isoform X2 n=1 Tax=Octopus sinensis TaxID=2607531 RepID=A0A7E6EZX9_9MOLL|nr:monocarboxylate transporter 10-like isoform X2 [Octopus sinensis]